MKKEEILKSQRIVEENTQRLENTLEHFSSKLNQETNRLSSQQPQQMIGEYLEGQTEEILKSARSQAERLIDEIQTTVDKGLQFIEERPLGTWATVFFSGYLLGVYAMRRRETRNARPSDLREAS